MTTSGCEQSIILTDSDRLYPMQIRRRNSSAKFHAEVTVLEADRGDDNLSRVREAGQWRSRQLPALWHSYQARISWQGWHRALNVGCLFAIMVIVALVVLHSCS